MRIPSEIFRAYDIRGRVEDQITPEVVRDIAQTYASQLEKPQGKRIIIGRDLRESSESLSQAAVEGLMAAGCHVIDIGQAPTPLVYFAIGYWECDGGVAITASHKPPEFNGMKLREGEWPFFGEQLQELCRATIAREMQSGTGTYEEKDIYPAYFEIAAKQVHLDRPVKVVLDVGNACGTLTAPRVLKDIGADFEVMFEEPDGTFPNRPPDPLLVESVQALSKRVVETGAELGVAIDADGDRIAVVDDRGEMVWPDQYMLPICHDVLADGPQTFITEVRCSQSLIDALSERGGTVQMRACGYPYILEGMRETGAPVGFETTGHCYFANPYIKFDDATYATARLLASLSRSDRLIREIVKEAPKYFTSDETRLHCSDENKFKVAAAVADMYAGEYEIIDVDGARVQMPEGWALIRASNTGEELVMRWEANSPEARDSIGEELLARVKQALEKFGEE